MTASQNKTSLSQLIDKTKDVDNCRDKEVIPGIFWMSEDNGANMLIDSRGDGDRVIVHLKPEFEIEKSKKSNPVNLIVSAVPSTAKAASSVWCTAKSSFVRRRQRCRNRCPGPCPQSVQSQFRQLLPENAKRSLNLKRFCFL